ncbi:UTRA domain-containing protein [Noviherbaspirillum sedimenti]|uniref:UTRA domain-containing protein n=1 Tax=Noviherbaspirillum sedimenti TaxID=2320865 RepID=A0A3A3G4B8_9BURK|nr:UTRA domain-containing protein [Noviherbaspirillum sedimenti]
MGRYDLRHSSFITCHDRLDRKLAPLSAAREVKPGTALLRIERLTYSADGKPLDFEHLYFRGDAFQYRLKISRRLDHPPSHQFQGNAPDPTRN